MLGVIQQTSSQAVYGETGRFPLHVRQQFRMIIAKTFKSKIYEKCQETILSEINDSTLAAAKT